LVDLLSGSLSGFSEFKKLFPWDLEKVSRLVLRHSITTLLLVSTTSLLWLAVSFSFDKLRNISQFASTALIIGLYLFQRNNVLTGIAVFGERDTPSTAYTLVDRTFDTGMLANFDSKLSLTKRFYSLKQLC